MKTQAPKIKTQIDCKFNMVGNFQFDTEINENLDIKTIRFDFDPKIENIQMFEEKEKEIYELIGEQLKQDFINYLETGSTRIRSINTSAIVKDILNETKNNMVLKTIDVDKTIANIENSDESYEEDNNQEIK
jgi:hypothetical protein